MASIGHPPAASKSLPQWLPAVSVLLAATLWGLSWYPLRWLDSHGLSGLWAALFIYSATLLPALPLLWRGRGALAGSAGLLLGIGLANGWCNVTFFIAIVDGNIVRILLLFYLAPVWAVLLGRWLLHEHLTPAAWATLGLALAGAAVMLWEPGAGWPWPQGEAEWFAISSGFAFALGNVFTRKAEHVAVTVKTGAAWVGCFGVAALWAIFVGAAPPSVSAEVVVSAWALGLFGIGIMTTCVLYGVSHMPVYRSAVIALFELVVGAASQQLLTDEQVLPREWLGGALIVLAALLTVRSQAKTPAAA